MLNNQTFVWKNIVKTRDHDLNVKTLDSGHSNNFKNPFLCCWQLFSRASTTSLPLTDSYFWCLYEHMNEVYSRFIASICWNHYTFQHVNTWWEIIHVWITVKPTFLLTALNQHSFFFLISCAVRGTGPTADTSAATSSSALTFSLLEEAWRHPSLPK